MRMLVIICILNYYDWQVYQSTSEEDRAELQLWLSYDCAFPFPRQFVIYKGVPYHIVHFNLTIIPWGEQISFHVSE